MTIDVQNSLGLLSASRAGEHLSLVTEVPEVVVRFGSFRLEVSLPQFGQDGPCSPSIPFGFRFSMRRTPKMVSFHQRCQATE